MALAVDSFEFLAREVIRVFTTARDALAIIGALYAAKKTLCLTWNFYQFVKVHNLSSLAHPDLVKNYGPWAVVTGSTHGIGKAFAQELAARGVNIIVVSIGEQDCVKVAEYLVVTGCTGGIGKAFCQELACRGVNIILLSRSSSKLKTLSTQLESEFQVKTHIVPVDFSEGRTIYPQIHQALEGKEIGILVNNVGVMYDYPDYFLNISEEKLWQLVHVNIAAATMMTHMILPQMVKRGKGAVIMMSSSSCVRPTPQMTAYAASKAYLDYFTKTLDYEYRSKGITIQCLLPFYVATRMTQYSSTLSNPSLLIPTAATYARSGLSTLGWSSRTPGYWPHSVQLWLSSWVPDWLWMWGASRLMSALRRQAHIRLRRASSRRSLPDLAAVASGADLANAAMDKGQDVVDTLTEGLPKEFPLTTVGSGLKRIKSEASSELTSSGSQDSFKTCPGSMSAESLTSMDS